MDEREGFVRAVRAAPDDEALRLVFADWLEERGDPLADYIRAECAVRAHAPGSGEWDAAMRRLLAVCEETGINLGGWEYEEEVTRVSARVRASRWPARFPVVPEPDLIRFEQRHGITLPDEYRAFLLQVGNGFMGLDTFDPARDVPWLARPFPHTPEVADALARHALSGGEGENPLGDPEDEEVKEDPRTSDGCLQIENFGCGGAALLVVRGVLRGQVWANGDLYCPWMDGSDGWECGFFRYLLEARG